MRRSLLAGLFLMLLAGCGGHAPRSAVAQEMPQLNPDKKTWIQAEEMPTFRIRARVLQVQGKAPQGQTFGFAVGGAVYPFEGTAASLTATDTNWSEWFVVGNKQSMVKALHHITWFYRLHPLTLDLYVQNPVNTNPTTLPIKVEAQLEFDDLPIKVEAQLEFDETKKPITLTGELMEKAWPTNIPGSRLGFLIWRGDGIPALGEYAWPEAGGTPQAATMTEYNQRYWKEVGDKALPVAQRPKKFPLVDSFAVYTDDRQAWQDGINHLADAGMTAVIVPPTRSHRQILQDTGVRRTAGGAYNPPGYAWEFGAGPSAPAVKAGDIETWAQQQVKPYLDAGFAPEEIVKYALSDEPNFTYPSSFKYLMDSPEGMNRFHDYLKAQRLQPADVGAAGWDKVLPAGRTKANGDLPSRRLFYWTMRFFAHDSARHFANSTAALEKAFYKGIPITTNWNNFGSRFYVPGSPNVPADKESPDAASGGHDWLEFGRLRGGTMLFTEDWYWDQWAPMWSYYSARMRAGAEQSGVNFGGYVVGTMSSADRRYATKLPDGLLQKVLALIGNGGKLIDYYRFGPEYNFPGSCYSEIPGVLPRIAEANRLIAAAEDVLWPGKRPVAQVGILHPRSSFAWDLRDPATKGTVGESQYPVASTTDYMAEMLGLYTALQHANIPADFVDEDNLTANGLRRFRVLYVTEPNIPVEGQRALSAWVRGGGTLVTVSNVGTRDRYDEPSTILSDFTGMKEQPRQRLLIPTLGPQIQEVAKGEWEEGKFRAFGARGTLIGTPVGTNASFEDGSSAMVECRLGRGRVVHFAFLPGLSYINEPLGTLSWAAGTDKLASGFSRSLRSLIGYPTRLANVQLPVSLSIPLIESSVPMIEAPLLLSDAGAAVTLLNWTGTTQQNLRVRVRVPFKVGSASSAQSGKLTFTQVTPEQVVVRLPSLGAADVLMLRK